MTRSQTVARPFMTGHRMAVAGAAIVIGLTGYLGAQERGGVDYDLSRQTAHGGGAMRAVGGVYELSGTIGQPEAGVSIGGAYQMSAGFWFPVAPGDVGEDGSVDLSDYAEFQACSTGPYGAAPREECQVFDVNHSGTIDLADFAAIQTSYTGP